MNSSAEQETIQRVFRLLAQRFHPDNAQTGDDRRFREIQDAYSVLNDPEKRARYDINYEQHRRNRWRLVSTGAQAETDFEIEQMIRLTLLEALYTKRRIDPSTPAIYSTELETMLGRAREQLEFTIWNPIPADVIARLRRRSRGPRCPAPLRRSRAAGALRGLVGHALRLRICSSRPPSANWTSYSGGLRPPDPLTPSLAGAPLPRSAPALARRWRARGLSRSRLAFAHL